ncbi:MAG: triphosphoribosyl-dephospho-CoA synthase [Methylocella sp.]
MNVIASAIAQNAIMDSFIAACRSELEAPKPGNVHVFADGHGMTVDHFLLSAEVAAKPLCEHGAPVGARIFGAVEATSASVGQNTNLGIVLLCAPLAAAAENAVGGDLRQSLKLALAGLTREDAQRAFDAILIAKPAGLGESGRHDVRAPAETTLLEAMKEAADRDRIAYQYATDYADVFDIGITALDVADARGWPAPWPAVSVYLAFLAAIPDSHIARKHGSGAAEAVQKAAAGVHDKYVSSRDPADRLADLLDFDRRLKADALNPGTSADLTVATLFADRLTRILIQRGNND